MRDRKRDPEWKTVEFTGKGKLTSAQEDHVRNLVDQYALRRGIFLRVSFLGASVILHSVIGTGPATLFVDSITAALMVTGYFRSHT